MHLFSMFVGCFSSNTDAIHYHQLQIAAFIRYFDMSTWAGWCRPFLRLLMIQLTAIWNRCQTDFRLCGFKNFASIF
jgi:hypothetical protein